MNLAEAFYEALVGQPSDEGDSFVGLLDRLAGVAGGKGKAAGLLGVNASTFYRWRTGRQRPKTGEDAVRRVLRRALLTPAREKEVKKKAVTLTIVGVNVEVSADLRPKRNLHVGRQIPASSMARIVNHWKLGNDDKVSEALWRAIDKHYVDGMEIDDFEKAYFS